MQQPQQQSTHLSSLGDLELEEVKRKINEAEGYFLAFHYVEEGEIKHFTKWVNLSDDDLGSILEQIRSQIYEVVITRKKAQ